MTKKESIFILFSITLCWSSTYIFIKDIPQEFSVYAYLALTSGVAGILLTLVMRKKLALLNRVSLRQGLILGALITASNMFEKLGLDQIPASSASVYASMGIIIVPLIMILKKEYPSRNNMVGILIILIGILTSNWGNTDEAGLLGGLYILGSAASMSVYTVLATEYTKETDPSLLPACHAVAAQHLCHCHGHVHDLIRLY
jgi:drug/metabolite transporter (DMT)-like permease